MDLAGNSLFITSASAPGVFLSFPISLRFSISSFPSSPSLPSVPVPLSLFSLTLPPHASTLSLSFLPAFPSPHSSQLPSLSSHLPQPPFYGCILKTSSYSCPSLLFGVSKNTQSSHSRPRCRGSSSTSSRGSTVGIRPPVTLGSAIFVTHELSL